MNVLTYFLQQKINSLISPFLDSSALKYEYVNTEAPPLGIKG